MKVFLSICVVAESNGLPLFLENKSVNAVEMSVSVGLSKIVGTLSVVCPVLLVKV